MVRREQQDAIRTAEVRKKQLEVDVRAEQAQRVREANQREKEMRAVDEEIQKRDEEIQQLAELRRREYRIAAEKRQKEEEESLKQAEKLLKQFYEEDEFRQKDEQRKRELEERYEQQQEEFRRREQEIHERKRQDSTGTPSSSRPNASTGSSPRPPPDRVTSSASISAASTWPSSALTDLSIPDSTFSPPPAPKSFQGNIVAERERLARKEQELFMREEELILREKELAYQERESRKKEQYLKEVEERLRLKEENLRTWRLHHMRGKVTMLLNVIFNDAKHYRQLLGCNKDDAQNILDSFQMLLDTNNFQDRTKIIAAMRRLSQETDLFPSRFALDGPAPGLEDEPVASGSYGDVYKLLHQGQYTCCKVIRVYQRSLAEHMSKIYARESIVWGQLTHPNIVPFYGISKFRSRVSFISHWAQHGEVNEYLKHNPDANRILLCLDTASGVEYLHQNDIVHGDLKGVNVLVDSSGRACLGDFGLSSVMDPEIIRWTSQSTIASKGGTTRWQAPELLEPEDVAEKVYNTKASDVYAWAGICYEIFTGQLPFFEFWNTSTVRKMIIQGDTPTRPSEDAPAWLKRGLNEHIWTLMMDCWRTQASERPDITMILSRLNENKLEDTRPTGDWEGRASMHFRNAQHEDPSKDMLVFWEELDDLLSRVVPPV